MSAITSDGNSYSLISSLPVCVPSSSFSHSTALPRASGMTWMGVEKMHILLLFLSDNVIILLLGLTDF